MNQAATGAVLVGARRLAATQLGALKATGEMRIYAPGAETARLAGDHQVKMDYPLATGNQRTTRSA